MKRIAVLLTVFILSLTGISMAGGPEGVSPSPANRDLSSGENVAVVSNACPTFSWSEVEDAAGYTIEVYPELVEGSGLFSHEDMASISEPVISKEAGTALSWTPSGGECLTDGVRYVWYVGSRMQDAGYMMQDQKIIWSEGKVFEVNLLSDKEAVTAVKETVGSYLTNEWRNTESYTEVKEEIKAEVLNDVGVSGTSGRISIMGSEGDAQANTYYGTGAGASIDGSGYYNAFFGYQAGNSTTGNNNTFMGNYAGYYNTTGNSNTFLGLSAGYSNTTGGYNTFMGRSAGDSNTTGYSNTFIGRSAGNSNTTGNGNVFLGYRAGYYETGSDKLYIDNSSTPSPLIYGEFDNNVVTVHGKLGIGTTTPQEAIDTAGGAITVNGADTTGSRKPGLSIANDGNPGRMNTGYGGPGGANLEMYSKGGHNGQRHGEMHFVYGGGDFGLIEFSHYNGSVWTRRMVVDKAGNLGLNVTLPSYPVHHSSGAHLTAGGVWTNASSRQYKEGIEEIKAEEAMETLRGLNPVKFSYKAEPEERHVGFIAEDVPELVATGDRKSLSPMDIVAVLTKVVKEQQRVNEEQQKILGEQQEVIRVQSERINALEAENHDIKAELRERMAILERQIKLMNSVASR